MVQACQLLLAKLEHLDCDEPAQRSQARAEATHHSSLITHHSSSQARAEATEMLRSCRAAAIVGFHKCKAELLQNSLRRRHRRAQPALDLPTSG